ncbi:MAG: hypothetical protein LBU07_07570 [Coriobacteriales bacterium]|jgi:hypothetical protein|nr:hypothetical protein [Coriobacteriales bacterium]
MTISLPPLTADAFVFGAVSPIGQPPFLLPIQIADERRSQFEPPFYYNPAASSAAFFLSFLRER